MSNVVIEWLQMMQTECHDQSEVVQEAQKCVISSFLKFETSQQSMAPHDWTTKVVNSHFVLREQLQK